jgi:hypothetical protein
METSKTHHGGLGQQSKGKGFNTKITKITKKWICWKNPWELTSHQQSDVAHRALGDLGDLGDLGV